MNHPFRWLACVIAFVCVATAVAGLLVEPSRAERWERVEAAVAKGLPKTAVQELEPLLAAALKEKDYPEAITALLTPNNMSFECHPRRQLPHCRLPFPSGASSAA